MVLILFAKEVIGMERKKDRDNFWVAFWTSSLLYQVWKHPSLEALLCALLYPVCAAFCRGTPIPRRYSVSVPLEVSTFFLCLVYLSGIDARHFIFALLAALSFTVLWVLFVRESED